MTTMRRVSAALVCCALAMPALAAEPAAGGPPPPQTVMFKVGVDATGHVQAATPLDPQAPAALLQAAEAYARRLPFTPARKAGVAVASQTYLSLVLAVEPADEGKFALKLRRAVSSPGVLALGKLDLPKNLGRRAGATISVSVSVDAEGKPDMDSFKVESVQLREPSSFAETRYLESIRQSVRHSRYDPDKVDGKPVASRLTLPYRFGMGGGKPKPGEEEEGRGRKPPTPLDPTDQPTMQGASLQPDVELPRVDYRAPASGA